MYEALPRDVYWKWCRNLDASQISISDIIGKEYPSAILFRSFNWSGTDEGRDYWNYICNKILLGNYKRESER